MPKRKGAKYKRKEEALAQETPQEIIKEFYRRMLMLQEEEKRKISRDLHDETAQIVIALGASFNVIEKEIKEGRIENALRLINDNRKMIQDIAGKMKSMAFTLRPPGLDILGLPSVLRDYFSQCTQTSPIKIEFNENIKEIKLSENIEITLYRILQEAIYNILKHSMAKEVKVNMFFANKRLKLSIEDDGTGFDVDGYRKQYDASKVGLRGIKERVDILNGDFFIESTPGKGTILYIDLPLDY